MTISLETKVREIALTHPSAIPVLERFGIDYCCGGAHTLAQACERRDVQASEVASELESSMRDTSAPEDQWRNASAKDLIQHIVEKHHGFARRQLELARQLSEKVERRHGNSHPEVFEVGTALAALTTELDHHFYCEENVLFPYAKALEEDPQTHPPAVFDSVERPVTRMMLDHNHTGDELGRIREATNGYQPPPDACTTYRALYRTLEELEQDLHRHIHLENNVLFPRVLKTAGKTA